MTQNQEPMIDDEQIKTLAHCEVLHKRSDGNVVPHGVECLSKQCILCGCLACRFCRRDLHATLRAHPEILKATKILPVAIMNEVLSDKDSKNKKWLCLNCIDNIQLLDDEIIKKAKWKKRLTGLGRLSTASLRREE